MYRVVRAWLGSNQQLLAEVRGVLLARHGGQVPVQGRPDDGQQLGGRERRSVGRQV